jgi:hypothetical protein
MDNGQGAARNARWRARASAGIPALASFAAREAAGEEIEGRRFRRRPSATRRGQWRKAPAEDAPIDAEVACSCSPSEAARSRRERGAEPRRPPRGRADVRVPSRRGRRRRRRQPRRVSRADPDLRRVRAEGAEGRADPLRRPRTAADAGRARPGGASTRAGGSVLRARASPTAASPHAADTRPVDQDLARSLH